MQIDFHHTTTYVLSRLAGFTQAEASTIACASQYVDDATNSGRITFTNGGAYSRISSAHKMLDYRNFEELANAEVWIPFHFLPGNDGQEQVAELHGDEFYRRLICRPNSPVAREMVRRCVEAHEANHGLHRLGITMHVYADTWAHQGFAGILHKINHVTDLDDDDTNLDGGLIDRLGHYFGDLFDKAKSALVDNVPLGHGAVLTHPDLPYLKWSYTNGVGERVERNNPADFLTASRHVFSALVDFRRARGDQDLPTTMLDEDIERISRNFANFTSPEGEERHEKWKQSIAAGDFSFGAEEVQYIAKGENSWKHAALGTLEDVQTTDSGYEWSSAFLASDWKLFHDALQVHRLTVLREVLPKFGICAA